MKHWQRLRHRRFHRHRPENRLLPPPTAAPPDAPPAPVATSASVPPAPAARPRQFDYPLVGRTGEWTAVLDAYAASRTNGHLIVLQGEAGIGKTRLAEEFLAYTQEQGGAAITAPPRLD